MRRDVFISGDNESFFPARSCLSSSTFELSSTFSICCSPNISEKIPSTMSNAALAASEASRECIKIIVR